MHEIKYTDVTNWLIADRFRRRMWTYPASIFQANLIKLYTRKSKVFHSVNFSTHSPNVILRIDYGILGFELSKKKQGKVCTMWYVTWCKKGLLHIHLFPNADTKKAIYSIQKELADITDSRFFMEWSICRKYTFQIAKKVSINYL